MFSWTLHTAGRAKLQRPRVDEKGWCPLRCHKGALHNCTLHMITISYSGAHKLNDALRIASTKWILPVIKPFFFASLVAAKRHSVFVTWHLAFRTNLQPSCHIYEAEFLWEQDRCKQSAVVLRLAWRHKPPPTDQKGEWRLPILGHEKVYFQASFHSKGSPPYSFSYVTFHSVVRHLQSLEHMRKCHN